MTHTHTHKRKMQGMKWNAGKKSALISMVRPFQQMSLSLRLKLVWVDCCTLNISSSFSNLSLCMASSHPLGKKTKKHAADKLSSYELSTVQPPLLVPVIFEIRYLLWDLMSWWKRWDGGNCVHRRITKQALDLLHLYQKGNAKCWNQANMEGYTEENASNWMWEMGVIWQSHALNETEWVCVCLDC